MRKVLWLVDGDAKTLVERANFVRAQAVCVRTTNAWLKQAIKGIKAEGIDVYAWRWPAVVDPSPKADRAHHFADNEATFACELIDQGLDGYIVDPEADMEKGEDGKMHRRASDWWADARYRPLATRFCSTIKLYGRRINPRFLFGTTSGGVYPTSFKAIPWAEFAAASDALFPQLYWQGDGGRELGGKPETAFAQGMKSWKTIAPAGMRIVPIIGQISKITAADALAYDKIIHENNINEIHFYSMTSKVSKDVWSALRSLGNNI